MDMFVVDELVECDTGAEGLDRVLLYSRLFFSSLAYEYTSV